MSMQGDILKNAVRALSNQQVEETKKLFNAMLATSKNLALYPEDHSICKDSISQLHARFETYLNKYGDIVIEIGKDHVICQGIEVKEGPFEEGTLPHTLFRDGIGWLQFTEGIEPEEIRQIFSIIHRYSVTMAEPQGDIVTDFWETRFEHVQYKADEYFSEKAPGQNDSATSSETTPSASEDEAATETKDKPFLSAGLELDPAAFELTPREEVELQEMVAWEEKASAKEHLNMLLDMLLQYEEKKDFKIVLEVLAEEFKGSFARHDFESALIILLGVREILNSGRLGAPWAGEWLVSFYHQISSDAECLNPLTDIWGILDVQQVETLQQIFQQLSPPVVHTLAKLLTVQQPQPHAQILENAVFSMISRDTGCLESLIKDSDEKIIVKLVPLLSGLEKDVSWKYLNRLATHSSASVRRKAVHEMMKTAGNQLPAMFEFIKDSDASIRRMVLAQMGKSRNERAENFLLQYLQNRKFSDEQSEHIAECFRVLGKCGSAKSVPFLSKMLMDWMSGTKTSLYRESAALALAALRIPEAQQVLEKASRSLRPGVRKIARNATPGIIYKDKGGR